MSRQKITWFIVLTISLWLESKTVWALEDFAVLIDQAKNAVVNISASVQPDEKPEESLESFLERAPRQSRGSGFIISPDGYVVTNAHVIAESNEIFVILSDRREYLAQVVGSDKLSDIALLKIAAADLPIVKFGDSEKLKVGQWVLAIGSPFGFDYSASKGIISALGRSLPQETYVPFIQMDVALNPGNSGGPLFNLDGEVIGVSSQIFTKSGGYMGVSFAVPINIAMYTAKQLQEKGQVSRGWLGVQIQAITSDLADSFGLTAPSGALVSKVMPDSPAMQAGVEVGDIILRFQDKVIERHTQLPALVSMTPIGEKTSLTVRRGGQEQTLEVTIAELSPDALQLTGGITVSKTRLKIAVEDLPEELRKELNLEGGVIIKKITPGPAAKGGLRPEDIILKLNQQAVENARQFESIVEKLPAERPFSLLIQRGNRVFFTALVIPEEKKP